MMAARLFRRGFQICSITILLKLKLWHLAGSIFLNKATGFTLVELMIVITMLGVLLGVGIPSFNTMIQDNRIASETNRVVANLSYSRTAASSRASVVTMENKSVAAEDWSQGWEIYTDQDALGNTTRVVADTLLRTTDPNATGVTILASAIGNRWISFRTNGMLNEAGNAVVIAVCDERGEANGRDITINLAGRVNLTSPSADCTP